MDILDEKKRTEIMSRVRSCNTGPEIRVRQILHGLGYRFRIHRKDLPGTPDIVLPGCKSVILVHGCFWHRHERCRDATTPKTRSGFWRKKFAENVARDRRNIASLRKLGWRFLVIWECDLRNEQDLTNKLIDFLS
ncbi:MAG: very short patch repair endonuclease [Pyrinomonadaceae bacterium]